MPKLNPDDVKELSAMLFRESDEADNIRYPRVKCII